MVFPFFGVYRQNVAYGLTRVIVAALAVEDASEENPIAVICWLIPFGESMPGDAIDTLFSGTSMVNEPSP
jgi:hypothetical protein